MKSTSKIACAGAALQILLIVIVNVLVAIGVRVEFHLVNPALQGSLKGTSTALLLNQYGFLLILFPPLWAISLIVSDHFRFRNTGRGFEAVMLSGVLFTLALVVLLAFSILYSIYAMGGHTKLSGG